MMNFIYLESFQTEIFNWFLTGKEKKKLVLPKISTWIMMIPKPHKSIIVEEQEEYDLEDEKVFEQLMQ